MSRYRQSMREALQEVAENDEVIDEAMKWEVKISGLPTFYSDGKSRGQVRQALRKMLKRPDDIESIERTTPAELKKIRRGQAKGEGGEEVKKEEVEDAFDYKAKKGAIAAPGSGSIAKAKKAKATDVNKSIEQQIKDALKEKANLNIDQVVNAIQFGHPFKVVDEEIPPELPGPETRRYANVTNAVVDKADKKSNKAMAKAQKDTLVPSQTKEEVVIEQEGGVTDDSGYTRYPSTGNWAGIKGKTYKKNLEIAKAKIKAQVKDKKNQNKDPVGKQHEETVDEILKWKVDVKGNPPAYMDGKSAAAVRQRERRIVKRPKDISTITRVTPAEYRKTLRQAAAGKIDLTTPTGEEVEVEAKKKVSEVAPPGWGHTKAEKEKTKPDKPKSKIGGSAHEFDKDLKSGKFKGLPGDKTMKDKKASMFKLMWAMKNKGDKPHYKPGVKDELKSKYKKEDGQDLPGLGPKKKSVRTSKRVGQIYTGAQVSGEENLLDSAKRYLNEKADWNTAFKSAAQSRPPMKYKDAVSFIDTAGLNSTEKRSALKAAKKWLR